MRCRRRRADRSGGGRGRKKRMGRLLVVLSRRQFTTLWQRKRNGRPFIAISCVGSLFTRNVGGSKRRRGGGRRKLCRHAWFFLSAVQSCGTRVPARTQARARVCAHGAPRGRSLRVCRAHPRLPDKNGERRGTESAKGGYRRFGAATRAGKCPNRVHARSIHAGVVPSALVRANVHGFSTPDKENAQTRLRKARNYGNERRIRIGS